MSGANRDFLTRKQAAEHLRGLGYPITHVTLARLAAADRGPPYSRFLKRVVRYERGALERWAAAHTTVVTGDGA